LQQARPDLLHANASALAFAVPARHHFAAALPAMDKHSNFQT
jgi:hypothetical protein